MATACGIIAYNRPHYLKWLLHSLELQENTGEIDYHLFIDGPRFEDDARLVKQSIKLFDIADLPNKTKHVRQKNVSIAINQFEAKNYLASRYDQFIIAEDDIILCNRAIELMLGWAHRLDDPKIFSVTMSFLRRCKLEEINQNLDKLITHSRSHWWFELYRSDKWRLVKPYFLEYYKLVKNVDYRRRNHSTIRAFYAENGFGERRTSQDSGMDYALYKAGMQRIMPVVNRGLYIGTTGTHFNELLAARYRFGEQVPYHFY